MNGSGEEMWHHGTQATHRSTSRPRIRVESRMNFISRLIRKLAPVLPAEMRVRLKRSPLSRVAVMSDYNARIEQETARFAGELDVNALPAMFHYWSNAYLRPLLESFGFSHPEDFFAKQILAHAATLGHPPRIISIGSGNCDAEIRIAESVRATGLANFEFECLDLTPQMLERGRELARSAGLEAQFTFTRADFNTWRPNRTYDVLMANQSLHHVLNLEHLFDAISEAIGRDGVFVTSDMIGRNGHQRWPEALAILQEFWQELPESYRYNLQLRRQEHAFMNWDCAVEGFEGIRAQDILPLLTERFGFTFFLAFGNVISPFVDRSFGHHFDPAREWDRHFIDRVHARDQTEIEAGTITPTHMMAVMRNDRSGSPTVYRNLTPHFCVRHPD
jgi:SAM-dependent methyltransferase